jgi:hypothetical protein
LRGRKETVDQKQPQDTNTILDTAAEADRMQCIECKATNLEDDRFCGKCGAELGHTSSVVERLWKWATWLGSALALMLLAFGFFVGKNFDARDEVCPWRQRPGCRLGNRSDVVRATNHRFSQHISPFPTFKRQGWPSIKRGLAVVGLGSLRNSDLQVFCRDSCSGSRSAIGCMMPPIR